MSAAQAGTSHDEDSVEAVGHGDEGNPITQLQSQILELGRRHDQVMSTLANMSNLSTRSCTSQENVKWYHLVVNFLKTVRL